MQNIAAHNVLHSREETLWFRHSMDAKRGEGSMAMQSKHMKGLNSKPWNGHHKWIYLACRG